MPTVLDALVVQLNLDPKQFGTGFNSAEKRANDFRKTIHALTGDETKLDAGQKAAVRTLERMSSQSQAARKELAAAGGAGADFWGIMKTGALGFGAALGINGLRQMTSEAISTNAALARMGPMAGMAASRLDTWVKAVREATGGSGEGVTGAIQGISDDLQGIKLNRVPEALLGTLSLLSSRSGEPPISPIDANGQPKSPDQLLTEMADPIKKLGPQLAHSLLSGMLPDELITFEGIGRKGVSAALDKAKVNTLPGQDYKDALEAAKRLNELSDAITKMKNILALAVAPRLTRDLTQLVATLQLLTGQISFSDYQKQYAGAQKQYERK